MQYTILRKERSDVTKMILIGNLISAAASLFLMLSTVTNDRRAAYRYQALESATLVISSVFFGAWVRLISQAFGAIRNVLVMDDKFTVPLMVAFTALSTGLGLWMNNEGWVGLIVIAATIQLTLCNYYCKSVRAMKIGFAVNLFLWSVYSFLISDVAYGIANGVIFFVSLASLARYERLQKARA